MSYGQRQDDYSFNPQTVPEDQREDVFTPVPEGWYTLEIDGVESKTSLAGGAYLNFGWKILGPSHAGRIVWDRITTRNDNPRAVEIGQGQLYRLAYAIGKPQGWQSLRELPGARAYGRLGIKKDEGFDPKNVIKQLKQMQVVVPVTMTATDRALGVDASPPSTLEQASQQSPYYDDDIPF